MKDIKIKDIINITGGKLILGNEEEICENFSNDTRNIKKGDTYIGLQGEKFDGSKFWKEAIKNGAKTIIVQNIDFTSEDLKELQNQSKSVIVVENTKVALQEIAKFKRNLYGDNFKLVGVTGSVGKTSTKDMIYSVVSQKYKTLKTEGNHNNDIGLPLTILKLQDHEAAVIEMGMNHFGEISYLTNIAKPNVAIITNIGTAHIGNLGSRENILKAKLEILEGLDKNGYVIINNDNELLHDWYLKNKDEFNIVTIGINNPSDYLATDISTTNNTSIFKVLSNEYMVPVSGEHFIYNALMGIAVGNLYHENYNQIYEGIKAFELSSNRMNIISRESNITIIDDSYNANYDSMSYAIKYLASLNGRRIAVLGSMFELGDYTEELHRKIGALVIDEGIDILVTVGIEASYIYEEAKGKIETVHFDNNSDAINFLKGIIKPGDYILIKASNSMKFKEIVDALR